MTFLDMLGAAQQRNQSFVCVGLDPDITRLPEAMRGDVSRIFDFCAAIVEATADLALAFKPQIAYFAAQRAEAQLERLVQHIRQVAPAVPVILDSKRGDIGSTAEQYAVEAFERYGCDAVTLSPLMGYDSFAPYLQRHGKGAFLLCRTSNPGGGDLQTQPLRDVPHQARMFEHIAQLAQEQWNTNGQLGLVVGATYPDDVRRVRTLAPSLPLLIPGVGAQGGDATATIEAAWRGVQQADGALLSHAHAIVNASRAILYASSGSDFARAARAEALRLRSQLQSAAQATLVSQA